MPSPLASDDDLARMMAAHVRRIPPFRALVRALESALLRRHVQVEAPVLDLGCGDGSFAAVTLAAPVAHGLDPDAADLARARRSGVYGSLHEAPAQAIPLPDGACGLVIANSVLEHIPDLAGALRETSRVLRPQGSLAITAPCHRFGAGFGVAVLLDRAGLRSLARRYRTWFNRLSRHHHLLSADQWTARLADAGFVVVHHEYYLSPAAMFWFDLLHYVSVPCLLARRTLGRWHWFGQPLLAGAWTAGLLRLARQPAPNDGACVFLLARRI
ncbi:MAG: class I SAM-dependent methyltransferase [Vicinamibacterales bacterium]